MPLLPPHLRLLDANANRAREGLRTLEDVARFVLDDGGLAAAAKAQRRALRAALERAGLPAAVLIAHRDTGGDVGTGPTTSAAAAAVHADASAMVIAAGNRATEALRVISETLRLDDGRGAAGSAGGAGGAEWAGGSGPAAAPAIEAIRYATYDLQRDVLAGLAKLEQAARDGAGPARCPQPRLCVLLTESMCARPWLDVARAAIAGGADCLQLREKGRGEKGGGEKALSDAELLARATQLVALAGSITTPDGRRPIVFINDRVDIALLAGADGVHLGQDDLPVASARALSRQFARPRRHALWIGVSTHDEAEAARALSEGADICGVGAMFTTSTKPRAISGPGYLCRFIELAAEHARVGSGSTAAAVRATAPTATPHLAIGGITPGNLPELAAAGCRGVAVSSVVCAAADPEAVCRRLCEGLERIGPVHGPWPGASARA